MASRGRGRNKKSNSPHQAATSVIAKGKGKSRSSQDLRLSLTPLPGGGGGNNGTNEQEVINLVSGSLRGPPSPLPDNPFAFLAPPPNNDLDARPVYSPTSPNPPPRPHNPPPRPQDAHPVNSPLYSPTSPNPPPQPHNPFAFLVLSKNDGLPVYRPPSPNPPPRPQPPEQRPRTVVEPLRTVPAVPRYEPPFRPPRPVPMTDELPEIKIDAFYPVEGNGGNMPPPSSVAPSPPFRLPMPFSSSFVVGASSSATAPVATDAKRDNVDLVLPHVDDLPIRPPQVVHRPLAIEMDAKGGEAVTATAFNNTNALVNRLQSGRAMADRFLADRFIAEWLVQQTKSNPTRSPLTIFTLQDYCTAVPAWIDFLFQPDQAYPFWLDVKFQMVIYWRRVSFLYNMTQKGTSEEKAVLRRTPLAFLLNLPLPILIRLIAHLKTERRPDLEREIDRFRTSGLITNMTLNLDRPDAIRTFPFLRGLKQARPSDDVDDVPLPMLPRGDHPSEYAFWTKVCSGTTSFAYFYPASSLAHVDLLQLFRFRAPPRTAATTATTTTYQQLVAKTLSSTASPMMGDLQLIVHLEVVGGKRQENRGSFGVVRITYRLPAERVPKLVEGLGVRHIKGTETVSFMKLNDSQRNTVLPYIWRYAQVVARKTAENDCDRVVPSLHQLCQARRDVEMSETMRWEDSSLARYYVHIYGMESVDSNFGRMSKYDPTVLMEGMHMNAHVFAQAMNPLAHKNPEERRDWWSREHIRGFVHCLFALGTILLQGVLGIWDEFRFVHTDLKDENVVVRLLPFRAKIADIDCTVRAGFQLHPCRTFNDASQYDRYYAKPKQESEHSRTIGYYHFLGDLYRVGITMCRLLGDPLHREEIHHHNMLWLDEDRRTVWGTTQAWVDSIVRQSTEALAASMDEPTRNMLHSVSQVCRLAQVELSHREQNARVLSATLSTVYTQESTRLHPTYNTFAPTFWVAPKTSHLELTQGT